jgi:hypothetical protein
MAVGSGKQQIGPSGKRRLMHGSGKLQLGGSKCCCGGTATCNGCGSCTGCDTLSYTVQIPRPGHPAQTISGTLSRDLTTNCQWAEAGTATNGITCSVPGATPDSGGEFGATAANTIYLFLSIQGIGCGSFWRMAFGSSCPTASGWTLSHNYDGTLVGSGCNGPLILSLSCDGVSPPP